MKHINKKSQGGDGTWVIFKDGSQQRFGLGDFTGLCKPFRMLSGCRRTGLWIVSGDFGDQLDGTREVVPSRHDL